MSALDDVKNSCKEYGIDYEILDSQVHPKISDTLILIKHYKVNSSNDNVVSIVLALDDSNSLGICNLKCWLSNNNLKSINNKIPKSHPTYGNFISKDIEYHPFSVKLDVCGDIADICNNLYGHINFNNE